MCAMSPQTIRVASWSILQEDGFTFSRVLQGALQSIDFNNGGYVQHITGLTQPADLRLDSANRVLYWCEETAGLIRRALLPALPAVPGTLTPQTLFSSLS
jgi:hypothetical protein